MSVAPELAPDVIIPARARRTSRATRTVRDVDGNVVTPTAFGRAARDDAPDRAAEADALASFDRPRRLRVVAPPTPWSEPALHRARGVSAERLRVRAEHLRAPVTAPLATPAPRPVARPAAGLRVTARGRLLLAVGAVVVGLGIALGSWLGGSSAATPATSPAVPAQVVVHDGDTLWSIASQVEPGHDPRQVVDRLRDLNGLATPDLMPGQVLRTR